MSKFRSSEFGKVHKEPVAFFFFFFVPTHPSVGCSDLAGQEKLQVTTLQARSAQGNIITSNFCFTNSSYFTWKLVREETLGQQKVKTSGATQLALCGTRAYGQMRSSTHPSWNFHKNALINVVQNKFASQITCAVCKKKKKKTQYRHIHSIVTRCHKAFHPKGNEAVFLAGINAWRPADWFVLQTYGGQFALSRIRVCTAHTGTLHRRGIKAHGLHGEETEQDSGFRILLGFSRQSSCPL